MNGTDRLYRIIGSALVVVAGLALGVVLVVGAVSLTQRQVHIRDASDDSRCIGLLILDTLAAPPAPSPERAAMIAIANRIKTDGIDTVCADGIPIESTSTTTTTTMAAALPVPPGDVDRASSPSAPADAPAATPQGGSNDTPGKSQGKAACKGPQFRQPTCPSR